eukprot:scaffold17515_cov116-Isochrysis_galbana.AAC.2
MQERIDSPRDLDLLIQPLRYIQHLVVIVRTQRHQITGLVHDARLVGVAPTASVIVGGNRKDLMHRLEVATRAALGHAGLRHERDAALASKRSTGLLGFELGLAR